VNPIRNIVDKIVKPVAPKEKPLIPLSLGDPTVFGNMDCPEVVNQAIIQALMSKRNNGYGPSIGLQEAREAIAKRYSTKDSPIAAKDIVIASGGSGAIALAIQALANPHDNILVPRPGFSLYATVAGHHEIKVKYYDLLPEKQWEADIEGMEKIVDEKTKAIIVNNPSNPCGANYSKQHLLAILAFAEKHKLPIISDEIYADMVFPGEVFYPLASLSKEVPILEVGGMAKQFSVPGWRVGWVILHDRKERAKLVSEAMLSLSQLILGASTLIQAALPKILQTLGQEHFTQYMTALHRNATVTMKAMETIPGLSVITPQGAMYLMVKVHVDKFKDIKDDQDFAQKLLTEEYVFVLPGQCFQAPNFFRVVYCAPEEMLLDACKRINAFCLRHLKE